MRLKSNDVNQNLLSSGFVRDTTLRSGGDNYNKSHESKQLKADFSDDTGNVYNCVAQVNIGYRVQLYGGKIQILTTTKQSVNNFPLNGRELVRTFLPDHPMSNFNLVMGGEWKFVFVPNSVGGG